MAKQTQRLVTTGRVRPQNQRISVEQKEEKKKFAYPSYEDEDQSPQGKALKTLSQYRDALLRFDKERVLKKKIYAYLNSRVDNEIGQWSAMHRKDLTIQGRPTGSFNIVKKYINRICGAQSSLQLDDKVFPNSDDADPLIAEVITDLVKHVKRLNMAWIAIRRMFRDGVAVAEGYIKCEFGDELDPFGDIQIKALNPLRVHILGEGEEYDINRDRKGIIEEIPMDKESIMARWPDSAEAVRDLPVDDQNEEIPIAHTYDYGFGLGIPSDLVYDKRDQTLKVLRKQYVRYERVNLMIDPTTNEPVVAPKGDKNFEATMEIAEQMGMKPKVVPKMIKKIYICYSVGNVLLEEGPSPYKNNRFDIIPFFCYTDNGVHTGVGQDLLDPQDEKNKRKSQAIHLLGTAAKNSYWMKKGFVDDENTAKLELGKTGAIILVNGEITPGSVQPIESNTSAVPALLAMEDKADRDCQEISGINDASLGIVPEGVKSGRGIQALQRPTETMIAEIHDNYLHSLKMLGTQIVDLIQQFYTEEKRVRIVGDYHTKEQPPEVVAMKAQLKAQMESSGLDEAQAILESEKMVEIQDRSKLLYINRTVLNKKLNDVTQGKYEFTIEEVAVNPTMRQQQYQDMLNARSLGAPIPWDLIVKYSDMRGKQEVLTRMDEEEQKMMAAAMTTGPRQATPPKMGAADENVNSAGAQF